MSQLSQVLSAYAVPLQVWLTPEARKVAADTLLDNIGERADVYTNPLSTLDELSGPAVLIITSGELNAANNDALKLLAKTAHPGRAILLGGTSDRDTLMTAINQWGVIRVLPAAPESQALINAVNDAESYLKREVALATAIDDLDIENTMLESAIDHLEGGIQRTKDKTRQSATTTFAAGLSALLLREQEQLSAAGATLDDDLSRPLQGAIRGLELLAEILDKTHDRSVEQSAELIPNHESLDDLIGFVKELIALQGTHRPGGHLGSGAMIQVEPLALAHVLIQLADRGHSGPATAIDSYRSGEHAIIEFRFETPIEAKTLASHQATRAWTMLNPVGANLSVVDADPHILRLSLQAEQDSHE